MSILSIFSTVTNFWCSLNWWNSLTCLSLVTSMCRYNMSFIIFLILLVFCIKSPRNFNVFSKGSCHLLIWFNPIIYSSLLLEIYHFLLITASALLWKSFGCICVLSVSMVSTDFLTHLHCVGPIYEFSKSELVNNFEEDKRKDSSYTYISIGSNFSHFIETFQNVFLNHSVPFVWQCQASWHGGQ